jgi:hypothetical protein
MKSTLLFVYNANSDLGSKLFDYAHKVFQPSTYACELCALTHDHFGERKSWKKFKQRTDVAMDFMYLRDFEERFNLSYEFPVILRRKGNEFEEIITKGDLKEMTSVEELIERLTVLLALPVENNLRETK